MALSLGSLIFRIIGDSSQAQADILKFKSQMKRAGEELVSIGKSLTTFVTVPLIGIGTAASKAAIDFESAFAGVRKTVDATEKEYAKLSDGIRQMAKEIPVAATEIAGIAESAGQLGIKKESILSFTRVIADLGVATNLTGEEAASTLAKFANITQMPQEQFDRLGATIVALGNNLATTEADIAAMAMRLAGAGNQVGMTEDQILSLAGALSSVGIEAEAGGSAFSRVIVDMQLATETGGGALQDFANVAGMSAKDFAEKFKEDAAGALLDFIDGLGKCESKGVSAIKVLNDMGIEEIRVRDALLRAAGAGDLFADSLELGSKAWKENNALTKEAEQRYKTRQSQITILKNTLVDLGITIGDILLPPIMDVVHTLTDLSDKALEFAEENPEVIDTLVKVAAAAALAGPAIMLVGKAIKICTSLGSVMSTVFSPVGLVIAGVIAAIAALALAWKQNLGGIQDKTKEAWGKITQTFSENKDKIMEIFNKIWDFCKQIWEEVGEPIFEVIGEVIVILSDLFQEVFPIILEAVEDAFDGIKYVWDNILKKVFDFFIEHVKKMLEIVKKHLPKIQELFGNVFNLISILWENIVKPALTAFWNAVEKVYEKVKPALDLIYEAFDFCFGKILEWVNKAIEGLIAFLDLFSEVEDKRSGGGGSANQGSGAGRRTTEFAEGGILTRPTIFGMVGRTAALGGEAGPEAVLPLSQLPEVMRQLSGEGFGGVTVNVYSPKAITAAEAAKEFRSAQRKLALGF